MACFSPLRAWKLGINESTGKNILKIVPGEHKELFYGGKILYANDENSILIPCGKCIGCRMAYAREWANRLMLEKGLHKSSYFITLTFNDDHILEQCCRTRCNDDGEVTHVSLSLNKRHVQLFMKRLRKELDYPVRFYAVGEYGGTTARPHYHLLIFGLSLESSDLTFLKRSELGHLYYSSALISRLWPYGFNVVTDLTWESCCYCARYMLKKQKGPNASVYSENNLEPPFSLMSRKPGIGFGAYDPDDLKDRQKFFIPSSDGVREFPPPKYLERLLENDFPEIALERKERRRQVACNVPLAVKARNSNTYFDYLAILEKNLQKAEKLLDFYRDL